jgi:hypothetical protein
MCAPNHVALVLGHMSRVRFVSHCRPLSYLNPMAIGSIIADAIKRTALRTGWKMTLHPRWGHAAYTYVYRRKRNKSLLLVYARIQYLKTENMTETPPRTAVVSARFSLEEVRELDDLAAQKGMDRTELLRSLVLKNLATGTPRPAPKITEELAEIVGVRLLIVNLLKPLLLGKEPLSEEDFHAITARIKTRKKILAGEIMAGDKE